MKIIEHWLDSLRLLVRVYMWAVARLVDRLSAGRLTPNMVTLVGLAMHVPIAILIGAGRLWWAAGLLVVFGLFDTLDGELARLQRRAGNVGMLLDAATDRFKEVMLYAGVAYAVVHSSRPDMVVWVVVACGASLSVSYVKAKGELAVVDSGMGAAQINRLFQDGLLRFEVRMGVLVLGLITGKLIVATVAIAVLAGLTAVQRLVRISKEIGA